MIHGETITVRRREQTGVDRDNNPVYGPPAEHEIDGCGIAPGSSLDVNEAGRAGVATQFTLYAPFGADVRYRDQVVCRGRLYEVNGDAEDWRSPFSGWEAGTVVQIRRVDG